MSFLQPKDQKNWEDLTPCILVAPHSKEHPEGASVIMGLQANPGWLEKDGEGVDRLRPNGAFNVPAWDADWTSFSPWFRGHHRWVECGSL